MSGWTMPDSQKSEPPAGVRRRLQLYTRRFLTTGICVNLGFCAFSSDRVLLAPVFSQTSASEARR